MTQREFLQGLAKKAGRARGMWSVLSGGSIRYARPGKKNNGFKILQCPIEFLAGVRSGNYNGSGAKKLGLSPRLVARIAYVADTSTFCEPNKAGCERLRAQMLKAVGLQEPQKAGA